MITLTDFIVAVGLPAIVEQVHLTPRFTFEARLTRTISWEPEESYRGSCELLTRRVHEHFENANIGNYAMVYIFPDEWVGERTCIVFHSVFRIDSLLEAERCREGNVG